MNVPDNGAIIICGNAAPAMTRSWTRRKCSLCFTADIVVGDSSIRAVIAEGRIPFPACFICAYASLGGKKDLEVRPLTPEQIQEIEKELPKGENPNKYWTAIKALFGRDVRE